MQSDSKTKFSANYHCGILFKFMSLENSGRQVVQCSIYLEIPEPNSIVFYWKG